MKKGFTYMSAYPTYLENISLSEAARALALPYGDLLARLDAGQGQGREPYGLISCQKLLGMLTTQEREPLARLASAYIAKFVDAERDDSGALFTAVVGELRAHSDGTLRLLVALVPASVQGCASAAVMVAVAANGLDGGIDCFEVTEGMLDVTLDYLHALVPDVVEGRWQPRDTDEEAA